MTKVIEFQERLRRKEVVIDPPVNADTILLKLYRRYIDEIFCMDCITVCDLQDASCRTPVRMLIIDVSERRKA